jgi:hypothetical protein
VRAGPAGLRKRGCGASRSCPEAGSAGYGSRPEVFERASGRGCRAYGRRPAAPRNHPVPRMTVSTDIPAMIGTWWRPGRMRPPRRPGPARQAPADGCTPGSAMPRSAPAVVSRAGWLRPAPGRVGCRTRRPWMNLTDPVPDRCERHRTSHQRGWHQREDHHQRVTSPPGITRCWRGPFATRSSALNRSSAGTIALG